MVKVTKAPRESSYTDALIPVLTLIISLALSVYLFGSDSSFGSNQISLILATAIAASIGYKNGYTWNDIHGGMLQGIQSAMGAILILLSVGLLVGTWILSGTVPAMLIYGIELISPQWFYVTSCLASAIVALSIGSSWSTAGTVGVGLMGISLGLDLDPGIAAGAIISGAYMGDKMSPLSDSTNLAPSVAGSELFSHIRHMTWTTVPAFVLSLIIFTILGFLETPSNNEVGIQEISAAIENEFSIGLHLLLPMLILFALARAKVPALASVLIGSLSGIVFALVFQQEAILGMVDDTESLASGLAVVKGVWITTYDGYSSSNSNETVKTLLSQGGMKSMLNTIWLIMCALAFGGVMESVGLLKKLVDGVMKQVKSTQGLLVSTLFTAFGVNLVASDQYMAIVLPGRAFREEYAKRGLDPLNLSRAIEDAGTVTSVLVPWNTCGAFMAVTLGVQTFEYLPHALFNILSPLIALLFALTLFKVLKIKKHN
jgi:NhaC family Na+:H+ antiporter